MATAQLILAQRMQTEAVTAFGYAAKNTFMDDIQFSAFETAPASRRTSSAPAALDSAQELFQTVKGNTEEEACDEAQGLLRTVIELQVDVEHADCMMRERVVLFGALLRCPAPTNKNNVGTMVNHEQDEIS